MADTPVAPVTAPSTNGVKPAAVTVPATPPATPNAAPPPDATAAELKTWRDRAEKAEALAAQKTREEIINRRKTDGERKTWGDKLKSADEYERLKREAQVNPRSAATKLWGEKYLEHLNTTAANGNAPTAESVAWELEQRDEKLRREFDERDQKRIEAETQARQRDTEAQMQAFTADAVEYAKTTVADFPIFEQFESPDRIGAAIINRIRAVHDATIRRDPQTNKVIREGRVMTFKEAADALETDLIGIAERAAGNPKYAEKLLAKLTPAKNGGTVPQVKSSQASSQGSQPSSQPSSQPRRTLGNDLTGSTPGEPPKYRTEEQRQAAALAAYEAHRKH